MVASILISLISLTITATFLPSRLLRIWLSKVVFPAPRNPEITVTGNCVVMKKILKSILKHWQDTMYHFMDPAFFYLGMLYK